jgi:hypothetical protein
MATKKKGYWWNYGRDTPDQSHDSYLNNRKYELTLVSPPDINVKLNAMNVITYSAAIHYRTYLFDLNTSTQKNCGHPLSESGMKGMECFTQKLYYVNSRHKNRLHYALHKH